MSRRRDGASTGRGRAFRAAAAAGLLLVVGLAPGPAGSQERSGAEGDVDADRVLRRAEATYDSLRTLRAAFRQEIEMRAFDPPRRRSGRGTWYQRKPGLFRMDFEEPEGDLVVSDGRFLWLYYPSTHPGQVVRTGLGPEATGGRGSEIVDLQGRILERARSVYEPSHGGIVTVDGHRTHLVELAPRGGDADYERVRVWVDGERWLVRRLEFTDRSETVRTVELDELETGIALPDSLFRFEPPGDVEVFEG